jgi:hypothetical protein
MGVVSELLKDVKIPRMAKVRQRFPRQRIENIPEALRVELLRNEIKEKIKPGMKIALTGGSRGIANVALVLKEVAAFVKEQGAEPFIIPAMGSHGGATAEGQVEILESLGITEEFCGCPIKASMEVKQIGFTADNEHPVLIDKYAAEADGIILVNRVKPHPAFRGPYESGLMKMMTIGLGKQKGAETCHDIGIRHLARLIPLFGNAILANSNVLFGIALLENPFDETCKIVALTNEEIPEKEPALLEEAKSLMPRIMFDNIDVLVVDKIGKNYSGDGMDPNITGRFPTQYADGGINAQRVAILDLSDETHGNANGLGMADMITRRLFEKTDLEKVYPNSLTSRIVCNIKIPMMLKSDKETIQAAILTCVEMDKNNPTIVRVPNTLHIEYIYISEALFEKAKAIPDIEIIEEPKDLIFDESGNLW